MAGAGPRHHAAQILWRGRRVLVWAIGTVDSVVITINAVLYLDIGSRTVPILLPHNAAQLIVC